MKTLKITFPNDENQQLTGYLELPTNQKPHNFAIFAHCFTCNKNFHAPKNVSRSLASQGFGVLRFDFTGLGESEGEFADSNFSGNVSDLIAAAKFLESEYQAPSLLVGHSLGGAATLFAAGNLDSIKAVATINAPSNLEHIKEHFESSLDELNTRGVASVNIGGRPFKLKKQFIEDLGTKNSQQKFSEFRKALLILHAPQDKIVSINHAEEIYKAAKHPKSFVVLDGADHLLSNPDHSIYAGEVIATWSKKYLENEKSAKLQTDHEVMANLGEEGFTTQIKAGRHYLIADEPESVGGNNFGPNPYELLSAGLAACTSMTIQIYARRKKWVVENVETHVSYAKKYMEDCENCEKEGSKIDSFHREIVLKGDLDEKQVKRLLEIADKCPVHRTLNAKAIISTQLKK